MVMLIEVLIVSLCGNVRYSLTKKPLLLLFEFHNFFPLKPFSKISFSIPVIVNTRPSNDGDFFPKPLFEVVRKVNILNYIIFLSTNYKCYPF